MTTQRHIDGRLTRKLQSVGVPDDEILRWDFLVRTDPTIDVDYIINVAHHLQKIHKSINNLKPSFIDRLRYNYVEVK